MASVNSITFDQAAYNPGDTITATVDYTPDAGLSQTFDLTANIVDSNGNQVATSSAPFVVNTPNPNPDTVAVSDTGGHTWTEGVATPVADGQSVPFTATA